MKHGIWLLVALTGLMGCDEGESPTSSEELGTIVEVGKADDFLSQSAQEYYVEGTATIELGAEWTQVTEDERIAEVQRLIPFKQVVIGWFLNIYLVDKDTKGDDEVYGGFKALTKNGSYEDMNIRIADPSDPLTYAFEFRQEVAGQNDLIRALPDSKQVDGAKWTFPLIVGRISTDDMQLLETDKEWYRKSPWSKFNPADVDAAQLETLELTIQPEPASSDAWLETERLFADDKLTVGIHMGWDYHNAYHEVHSKDVYGWLTGQRGFKSPTASWEELEHDSGPLTGTVRYNGRTIDVEVSLFWGKTGAATDPDTAEGGKQLEADMLESLAKREIVIFNGHSGPFYGFALANWRKTSEGDLDDTELAQVPLLTGSYQLIVAEGCDTYALGQAFYDNPHKDGLTDLDVITTTSFSNASTAAAIRDVLGRFLGRSSSNNAVEPSLFGSLMDDLDNNSYWFSSMYGVHGIDDNPQIHPWADVASSCASCNANRDCGAGMRCITMKDGARGCAAECTSSDACPSGYGCRNVQSGGWLSNKVCAPTSLSCTEVVEPVKMVLNEILINASADYNGDGEADARDDEFIELLNIGGVTADLSGWSISDGVGARHVFPAGTTVAPGGAVVVFGGGAPELSAGTTTFLAASTKRLALNNTGDSVRLSDVDGNTIDSVTLPELDRDASANRVTDGVGAGWVYDAQPTPGVGRDGSNY